MFTESLSDETKKCNTMKCHKYLQFTISRKSFAGRLLFFDSLPFYSIQCLEILKCNLQNNGKLKELDKWNSVYERGAWSW